MYVIDFDGTIVDLWPRYCSVFKAILNLKSLSIDDYKIIKQKLKRDSLVAEYFGKQLPNDYFSRKASMLEDRDFLLLDSPLIDISLLNNLLLNNAIILTKRRNEKSFQWQLVKLGIYERYVVIDSGKKIDWVRKNLQEQKITVIGDSTAELEIAQLPNVDAWMVGYGLSDKADFDLRMIPYNFFNTPVELEYKLRRQMDAIQRFTEAI